MSQGADGVGGRPGLVLPTRVHDLLLGLAGRLDDDAIADARQFLASAELDRALEFVAGCLVSGRTAITDALRAEIDSLFTQVNLDPAMTDGLVVDDSAATEEMDRHRWFGDPIDGESPVEGVAHAARQVLDVLPDVRSVWAAWRLTPAGPASGPVPHRVVLVGVGPSGFAPATSYRMEYTLRRAGIRASVEVLRDGADAPDYHHQAMQFASQVPFSRQALTANPAPVRPRGSLDAVPPGASPSLSSGASTRVSALPGVAGPPQGEPNPPTAQVAEITPPGSGRRARPESPADPLASANPPVRQAAPLPAPWMNDPPEPAGSRPNGTALEPVDESLSDQEKVLLRQLQEELARREQQRDDTDAGRHIGQGTNPFDQPTSGRTPTVINGLPPQPPDQHR